MAYVTPLDMQSLYDAQILVQVTNYSDRRATSINSSVLTNTCNVGNRILDGYLLGLGIPLSDFSEQFINILKVHAARLAMDFLAGTDPQIREQAKESQEWLKSLNRLAPQALQKLVTDKDTPLTPASIRVLPRIEFEEGWRWEVTL